MFKKILATTLLGAFTSSTALAISQDGQILKMGFNDAFENVQEKLSGLFKKEVTIEDKNSFKQTLITNPGALMLSLPKVKFDGKRGDCSELFWTTVLSPILAAEANKNLENLSGLPARSVAVTEMMILDAIKMSVASQFEIINCKFSEDQNIMAQEYVLPKEDLLREWDKKLNLGGKLIERVEKAKNPKK